jgi:hypothetical protein
MIILVAIPMVFPIIIIGLVWGTIAVLFGLIVRLGPAAIAIAAICGLLGIVFSGIDVMHELNSTIVSTDLSKIRCGLTTRLKHHGDKYSPALYEDMYLHFSLSCSDWSHWKKIRHVKFETVCGTYRVTSSDNFEASCPLTRAVPSVPNPSLTNTNFLKNNIFKIREGQKQFRDNTRATFYMEDDSYKKYLQ